MPTIGTFRPAALRRRLVSAFTFVLITSTPSATHFVGSGWLMQRVTSLPPIETVIRPTLPRLAFRNASAAAVWVFVYTGPPSARARFTQPLATSSDVVVAPPQPKFTSLKL